MTELEFTLKVAQRRIEPENLPADLSAEPPAPLMVYGVTLEFPKLGLLQQTWDANAVLGIELCAMRMAALLTRRGYSTQSGELLEAMLEAWENGAKCESTGKFTVN